MDARRFDNLTRSLASRASRRSFIRTLLGLGGAATFLAVQEQADARTLRTRNTITTSPPAGCPGGAQYCGGVCCGDGQTCCNQSCCAGTCQNGVCCPSGTTNCGSLCCDSSTVCCGSICCGSAELCSASGTRCCSPGTSVCGEECCPDGQDCCDGECCNGTCYGEELCCPAGREVCGSSPLACCPEGTRCCGGECCAGLCSQNGAICCGPEATQICGDECCNGECAADGVTCCVNGVSEPCGDSCCEGSCAPDGVTCCSAGRDTPCGDTCCDTSAQECCTDADGVEICIDLGGCCRDDQCPRDTRCPGRCNFQTHSCDYSPAETECGSNVCSQDGLSLLTYRCSANGICEEQTQSCGDYYCLNDACLTSCTEGEHCQSGLCNEDGSCCAVGSSCNGAFCCEPDPENPLNVCCPGDAACCDCFFDSRDNEDGFCFNPADTQVVLCGDTLYATSHYACVGDRAVVKSYVCADGQECPTPCCGGTGPSGSGPGGICCDTGEECSNGVCVAAATSRLCNEATVGTDCLANETCASRGSETGDGYCCPAHRSFENFLAEEGGAPVPYYDCCASNQHNAPSQVPAGHPYCSDFYELGTTSVKSWSRR